MEREKEIIVNGKAHQRKRVELHCHSNFSARRAIGTPDEYMECAGVSGFEVCGIAFADIGTVTGWPEIQRCHKRSYKDDFKVIYGTEINVTDDRKLEKQESGEVSVYPLTILCKNKEGIKNLNSLLTESEYDGDDRYRKISLSLLKEKREGLLVGGGFVGSMLYQAIVDEKKEEEIEHMLEYLDYIEIQPIDHARYLIYDKEKTWIHSEEDLKRINKKLFDLGEKYHIPVVATSNCYYIQPEAKKLREMLVRYDGVFDASKNSDFYFRSTTVMIKEFSYLGEDRAWEVVTDNSNFIAEMCEQLYPFQGEKHLPKVKDANKRLREHCMKKAKELYGNPLSEEIQNRLEWELAAIERTEMASVLLEMMELWNNLEVKPYEIMLRGTEVNSMVAYLCGMGDVDPIKYGLSPYFCFGMEGEKNLSINVNLPAGMMDMARLLCRKLEGIQMAVRTGITGRIGMDKANAIIENYEKATGEKIKDERERCISQLATVVDGREKELLNRVLLIPEDINVNEITPLCRDYCADKEFYTEQEAIDIDHLFLHVGLLPHQEVEMVYDLFEETGVNPAQIKEDDPKILSLFSSPKALGISPDIINGINNGLLGLVEAGTLDFSEMLSECKVNCFDDAVRIRGLIHGTNLWDKNGKRLMHMGKATLSELFCSREDVYDYLVEKGIAVQTAYMIADQVGRGRHYRENAKDKMNDWKELLKSYDVSSEKIGYLEEAKYMFPRGENISYMKLCWKEAYFKIYYPKEFYRAYFKRSKCKELVKAVHENKENFEKWASRRISVGMETITMHEYYEYLLAKEMFARGITL